MLLLLINTAILLELEIQVRSGIKLWQSDFLPIVPIAGNWCLDMQEVIMDSTLKSRNITSLNWETKINALWKFSGDPVGGSWSEDIWDPHHREEQSERDAAISTTYWTFLSRGTPKSANRLISANVPWFCNISKLCSRFFAEGKGRGREVIAFTSSQKNQWWMITGRERFTAGFTRRV